MGTKKVTQDLYMNRLHEHVQQSNPALQQAWYLITCAQRESNQETQETYLQLFWETIEHYYKTIAQFDTFQCAQGCGHCCYDNPHGVSALELKRILPLLSDDQKQKIRESKRQFDLLTMIPQEQRQIEWKRKCIPCPLLDNESCSVYDVRPLACRSFFSVHDPNWCHPLHPQYQEQPQIGHDDIHSLLQRISVEKGLAQSGDLISGLFNMIQETLP